MESSGADFSDCRTFRYRLWRTWDDKPACNFLMLNPSTADETVNDQTIRLCIGRAQRMGHGGIVVTNLFAYRATYPKDMKAAPDPVGPDNDDFILAEATAAGMVICAWGKDGKHKARDWHVRRMLQKAGVKLHAIKLTKDGFPCHPLRLSYDLVPVRFDV